MARSFNGTTDFIDIPGLQASTICGGNNTTPFSLSAWANLAAGAGSFPVILTPATGGTTNLFFGVNIGNFVGFNLYFGGGQSVNNSTPSTNVWHQVVGTYNGTPASGISLYVDGVSVGGVQSGAVAAPGSSVKMQIANGTFAGNSFWKGSLADVAIWNVALTAGEAAALSKGIRPAFIRPKALLEWQPLDGLQSPEPDFSGNAANGTVTGTALAFGPPLSPLTPLRFQDLTPPPVTGIFGPALIGVTMHVGRGGYIGPMGGKAV